MPNVKISINYDADKLAAIRQFIPDNTRSIEDEMAAALDKQYAKIVPLAVRSYIENKGKTITGISQK